MSGQSIRVGIASGPTIGNISCFDRTTDYNYGYSAYKGETISRKVVNEYGSPYGPEMIKIKLDLSRKQLHF